MSGATGPRTIYLEDLKTTMREGIADGRRYCFILGAGASAASGIKTGEKISGEWLTWIRENVDEDELKQRMEYLGIPNKSLTGTGKDYFDLFDLRFYADESGGYTYLRNAMEKAQPSFGYYTP